MQKAIFKIKTEFVYNPLRKRAPYSIDGGKHWCNHGELMEALLKHDGFGYELKKDANTPFDAGSDIEELHMSVKSSKATLTSKILGHDLKSSLDCYFERVASTSWAWVVDIDETLVVYIMNADEFRTFAETWASYNEEMKVRFKAVSIKMMTWLEERV